jgi:hypothetical protein
MGATTLAPFSLPQEAKRPMSASKTLLSLRSISEIAILRQLNLIIDSGPHVERCPAVN